MVSFLIVQELSSNSSSSGSSFLSPISLEEEIQLETPLEALEGTPYMGRAYPLIPFAVIYPVGGEMGDASAPLGQGTATPLSQRGGTQAPQGLLARGLLLAHHKEPPRLRLGGYPGIGSASRPFIQFPAIWTSVGLALLRRSWMICVYASKFPPASR